MIAERVEDNVLQSSIPGEQASWWWAGRHLPSREENHKEKKTRSLRSGIHLLFGRMCTMHRLLAQPPGSALT